MIVRIWHGTTSLENASSYKKLLLENVFPGIKQKNVMGYKGIQLLEIEKPDRIEFITIMGFENWRAVKDFAGEDYENSYVIPEAKMLLAEYDQKAQHYELLYNDLQY